MTRRYGYARNEARWELELDDDGTFRYVEEESHPEYSIGADASGRWTANGARLSFVVTKSNFGKGREAWLVGRTESGTLAGDVVVLEDGVSVRLTNS